MAVTMGGDADIFARASYSLGNYDETRSWADVDCYPPCPSGGDEELVDYLCQNIAFVRAYMTSPRLNIMEFLPGLSAFFFADGGQKIESPRPYVQNVQLTQA
jgi:hypothetical protein